MSSIKMAKLDFLTIKTLAWTYFLLALVISALFSISNDSFLVVSLASAWSIALLGTVSFQVQETNSLERFYSSVALKQSEIVIGRFLSTLLLYALTLLASILVFIAVMMTRGMTPQPLDIITGICVSLLFFSVMIGFSVPILFKMGFTKGRLIATLIVYAMFIALMLPAFIPVLGYPIEQIMTTISDIMIPLCIFASVVILFVSYRFSLVAYRKRR